MLTTARRSPKPITRLTIAATTTAAGLRVHAELDTSTYGTGLQISDAQMDALPLTLDQE